MHPLENYRKKWNDAVDFWSAWSVHDFSSDDADVLDTWLIALKISKRYTQFQISH